MPTVTAQLRSGMRTVLATRQFTWLADEPNAGGGTDQGPTPYEILVGALAACTAVTLRWWAERHGVGLAGVDVTSEFDRVHADDCEECEKTGDAKIERIRTEVRILGDFDDQERARLEQIVSRCPVHKTLAQGVQLFETVEFGPPED
jgi:putative redox protein